MRDYEKISGGQYPLQADMTDNANIADKRMAQISG